MTTRTKKPKKMKPQRRWAIVLLNGDLDADVFHYKTSAVRRFYADGYSHQRARVARVEIREVAK